MPSAPPDVVFDDRAATELCLAVQRLIGALEDATEARWRAGRAALQFCEGPFADDLDAALADRCAEGAVLAENLAGLLASVRARREEAAAAQQAVRVERAALAHARQIETGELLRQGVAS